MIFFKRWKIRSLTKKLKAMQANRHHNQPSDDVLAKEISMYMRLSVIYKTLHGKKKYPFSEVNVDECLRAAANLDFANASYELGERLLEKAKFRQKLEVEVLFANPNNAKQAEQLFAEAHAYLAQSDKLGHVLAKRLRGLCYINNWGVESDKDKGFDLVVASIDQENSWDKVPQIFAAIGLNKPEFFSALGKHRRPT